MGCTGVETEFQRAFLTRDMLQKLRRRDSGRVCYNITPFVRPGFCDCTQEYKLV